MKLTIITPSFNQASFIEQTIDSVLSQNYSKLEYIIIDGGSTDESAEIIKRYEKHLTYWVSERDRGQSDAINKGLRIATGDVVNWLNSDDYLQQGSLHAISNAFQDPSVKMVSGRSNIVENGKIIRITNGTDIYSNNLPKTLGYARIDQPETFFRRSIFEELGFIDETLHFVMDKEFWMRYLIRFGIQGTIKIPDIIANFRWHGNSKTQSQSEGFVVETNQLMYQLALTNNYTWALKIIERYFGVEHDKSIIRPSFLSNDLIVEDALRYYILLKADEAYYQNRHSLCNELLSKIDVHKLHVSDQSLFKKLKFRSRYIPILLKKYIHKWR